VNIGTKGDVLVLTEEQRDELQKINRRRVARLNEPEPIAVEGARCSPKGTPAATTLPVRESGSAYSRKGCVCWGCGHGGRRTAVTVPARTRNSKG
jgi:hypothetical protein